MSDQQFLGYVFLGFLFMIGAPGIFFIVLCCVTGNWPSMNAGLYPPPYPPDIDVNKYKKRRK